MTVATDFPEPEGTPCPCKCGCQEMTDREGEVCVVCYFGDKNEHGKDETN